MGSLEQHISQLLQENEKLEVFLKEGQRESFDAIKKLESVIHKLTAEGEALHRENAVLKEQLRERDSDVEELRRDRQDDPVQGLLPLAVPQEQIPIIDSQVCLCGCQSLCGDAVYVRMCVCGCCTYLHTYLCWVLYVW